MNKSASLLLSALLAALAGCSGLDASGSFGCRAPDGVNCQSLSGVYANSLEGTLPSQQINKKDHDEDEDDEPEVKPYDNSTDKVSLSPKLMAAPSSGVPIRKPPQVLRVWVAPWEDDAGDLHDQSYFYTQIAPGKWVIEASRKQITTKYKPVYASKSPSTGVASSESDAPRKRAPQSPVTLGGAVAGNATTQGSPLGGALSTGSHQ